MLRCDLCDYSDTYIVVKGVVTVSANDTGRDRYEKNRDIVLKDNAPFISCISKINGVLIQNAEDLDIVMPMYNLLKYSKNYSKTSGSLCNYYRDELTDEGPDVNGLNKNVINSKSFEYRASITYNAATNNPGYNANKRGTKEVKIAILLKQSGNFWNSLNILLINCEVSLCNY